MELIEPKRAKEFASTLFNDPILKMAVNAVLDKTPKLEIVNCKDCKWKYEYCQSNFYCDLTGHQIYEDDFCSYGERE